MVSGIAQTSLAATGRPLRSASGIARLTRSSRGAGRRVAMLEIGGSLGFGLGLGEMDAPGILDRQHGPEVGVARPDIDQMHVRAVQPLGSA
ncbi:hypothetical protein D3877_17955 [Azospirillum cavernae]|uniref:Uncharacterized protein n=1 Tax=Azospirillum cavernae TaxID=2320860 RepID=A0A418VXS1_9PROT|nr:hypothetical protein D3877_17955 [Azospirillum cavernae]